MIKGLPRQTCYVHSSVNCFVDKIMSLLIYVHFSFNETKLKDTCAFNSIATLFNQSRMQIKLFSAEPEVTDTTLTGADRFGVTTKAKRTSKICFICRNCIDWSSK